MNFVWKIIKNHLIKYPSPFSLNFNWGFGSLAGLFLFIQIITGLFLAFYYIPHPDLAFFSVERTIMRDIHNGWLVRYIHMNGASFFFLVVYLHIARSLYYRTYKANKYAWFSGVVLFVLLMATAFMGYVLPWSQMSYWAATVITNLFSTVPLIGSKIVYWLWGGYSVNENTLKRFYTLHFLLGLILAIVSIIHIYYVHRAGSSKPIPVEGSEEVTPFSAYFSSKDVYGFLFVFFIFMTLVLLYPLLLSHPDQFVKANVLVTPKHIVPEWYFLPFYAILRSVPNKNLGVILLVLSLISLLLIPLIDGSTSVLHPRYNFYYEILFYLFIFSFLMLGYLGSMPATEPYVLASKIFTFVYFFYFLGLFILSRWINFVWGRDESKLKTF